MEIGRSWSLAIIGFSVLVVGCLISYLFFADIGGFFVIVMPILAISVIAVLCVKALVGGARGISASWKGRDGLRLVLRWVEVLLGLFGFAGIAYLYIAMNPGAAGVNERIAYLIVLVFSSVIGYLLLANWRKYGFEIRAVFAVAWLIGAGYSGLGFIDVFFTNVEVYSPRDAIINDINNIAARAYQFRIRPASMGGGEGSYVGFEIPTKMRTNENAEYGARVVTSDLIELTAISSENKANTVVVFVNEEGKLKNWTYTGDFQ
jgi:hypothetical protein